jgi:hypothetical protein
MGLSLYGIVCTDYDYRSGTIGENLCGCFILFETPDSYERFFSIIKFSISKQNSNLSSWVRIRFRGFSCLSNNARRRGYSSSLGI